MEILVAGPLENPEDGFGLQQAILEEVASGERVPAALMWTSSPYVGATRPETRLAGFPEAARSVEQRIPGAQFTADMDLALESVAKLGALTFETLLVGHGVEADGLMFCGAHCARHAGVRARATVRRRCRCSTLRCACRSSRRCVATVASATRS